MTSVSSRFRPRSQHALTYSGRPSEVSEPSGARKITEFAGDHVLVPMALDCVSDQFLIAALTVTVRAVEKIDADLARPAQGLDRRISVGLIVERRHRHAAEPDRGNLKPAESPPLHPSAS